MCVVPPLYTHNVQVMLCLGKYQPTKRIFDKGTWHGLA